MYGISEVIGVLGGHGGVADVIPTQLSVLQTEAGIIICEEEGSLFPYTATPNLYNEA